MTKRQIILPAHDSDIEFAGIRGASGVDRITQAHELCNLWATRGFAEVPADRPRAQDAVRAIYRMMNLPEPKIFVWVKSPTEMAKVRRSFEALREDKASLTTFNFCQDVRRRVGPQAGSYWDDCIVVKTMRRFNQLIDNITGCEQTARMNARVMNNRFSSNIAILLTWQVVVGSEMEVLFSGKWATHALFGGQWNADWVARGNYVRQESRHLSKESNLMLDALSALAASASMWWPYRSFCVMCERPEQISLDSNVRLHNTKGKALRWADGTGWYRLSGMEVPSRFIEEPDKMTPEMIEAEGNSELRRCLIEVYGEERYLKDSGAAVVSHGRNGARLWARKPASPTGSPFANGNLFSEEAFQMVEVINSTPEADGHFKHYFIRVPPSVTSADEAVAWTFGVSSDVYVPQVET